MPVAKCGYRDRNHQIADRFGRVDHHHLEPKTGRTRPGTHPPRGIGGLIPAAAQSSRCRRRPGHAKAIVAAAELRPDPHERHVAKTQVGAYTVARTKAEAPTPCSFRGRVAGSSWRGLTPHRTDRTV